jgi:folylpolyglutamate synthase/dihydropteroate synthase
MLLLLGLKTCNWPGRNQKICGPNITYYLDGAHTDNSIQVTMMNTGLYADWLKLYLAEKGMLV